MALKQNRMPTKKKASPNFWLMGAQSPKRRKSSKAPGRFNPRRITM